jgi:uncharacterized membrane protein
MDRASDSLITWTHVGYALHAFSLLTGIIGTATVVGAFLTGWPSIIAVILNYLQRSEARGIWLESHFRWQIRTFWFGLLWIALCVAFIIMTLGIGTSSRGCRWFWLDSGSCTGSFAAGWPSVPAGRCTHELKPITKGRNENSALSRMSRERSSLRILREDHE